MALFRKRSSQPSESVQPDPPAVLLEANRATVPGDPLLSPTDALLDTIVSVVRALGRFAFDLDSEPAEQFRKRCQRWIDHLTLGKALEGEEELAEPMALGQRQFKAFVDFFVTRRRLEFDHLSSTASELRSVAVDLIGNLRRAVVDDTRDDDTIAAELSELTEAVQSDSLTEIRKRVERAQSKIGEAIDRRRERQQKQVEELGDKLKTMGASLYRAEQQSREDALTGVYNRRAFDEALPRYLDLCGVANQPTALLLVDLDHFKRLNDTHGHQAGDAVLEAMGRCLLRTFVRKNDFVGRYGGEEFVVILPDCDRATAELLAKRLLESVRKISVVHGAATIGVTCSIGVAVTSQADEAAPALIERADAALYSAKDSGRDRAVVSNDR